MRTFKQDMAYGMNGEGTIHTKIQAHFCDLGKITNTKELYNNPYCKYDYEAEDGTRFELKTRRCKMSQYPTTIVPATKITKDARQFFIFSFTDGCYKIEYDKDLFAGFTTTDIQVFRYGRNDRPTPHIHIPVEYLQEMK